MPKQTHVEREKAIRMLQANVTPPVLAQKFRCHSRMIERLIPLFHTGHESPDSPRIDFFLIRGDS